MSLGSLPGCNAYEKIIAQMRHIFMILQVMALQTDLEVRKETQMQVEEEKKIKEEINQNLEMTLNELNKKIIVSMYLNEKVKNVCIGWGGDGDSS